MANEIFDQIVAKAAEAAAEFPPDDHPAIFIGSWLAQSIELVALVTNDNSHLVSRLFKQVLQEWFPDLDGEVETTVIKGLLFVLVAMQDTVAKAFGPEALLGSIAGMSEGTKELGTEWHLAHAVQPDPVKVASALERFEHALAQRGVKVDLGKLGGE